MAQVTAFIPQETASRSGHGRAAPACAVRSFLRFLAWRGVGPGGLDRAIPPMRRARHASLPPRLAPAELVRLLDQPYRMGWHGEELYIEVHAPLEGQAPAETRSLTNITRLLVAATQNRTVAIDWAKAERAFILATGVPEQVLLHPATVQAAGDTPGGG